MYFTRMRLALQLPYCSTLAISLVGTVINHDALLITRQTVSLKVGYGRKPKITKNAKLLGQAGNLSAFSRHIVLAGNGLERRERYSKSDIDTSVHRCLAGSSGRGDRKSDFTANLYGKDKATR